MLTLRAVLRAGALISIVLPLMLVQSIALRFYKPLSLRIPVFFHRTVCRILGIRIQVKGHLISHGGVLLASNHTSWLDIPILSSLRPCSFVAKSEVATWAFFGTLARLQRSVFVERSKRTETARSRDEIVSRLSNADALVLFPEGTSGDGNGVYPFKSALMGAADLQIPDKTGALQYVPVQPISVAYVGDYGLPIGRVKRPLAAWYGQMQLVPHLWEVLKFGTFDVIIECHKPMTLAQIKDRKALALACETAVATGLGRAITGRAPELELIPRRATIIRNIPGPASKPAET